MAKIDSKEKLEFYLKADLMMNRGCFKYTLPLRLKKLVMGDKLMDYLICMRKLSYYKNRPSIYGKILRVYYRKKYISLGHLLGFSIGEDVFGYGLVIPHNGTIVINENVVCGNYCVLHTSTCIAGGDKNFGNALYLATGAKIYGKINCGDGITVAANCVLSNKEGANILFTGIPAFVKKNNYHLWYEGNETFLSRIECIEKLKKTIKIDL